MPQVGSTQDEIHDTPRVVVAQRTPSGHDRRMGAPRGVRQRGREASYDPASPMPYRPGPTFRGAEAVKLTAAAAVLGISTSELLNELVRQMDVDTDGCPTWAIEYVAERHPKGGPQMQLTA